MARFMRVIIRLNLFLKKNEMRTSSNTIEASLVAQLVKNLPAMQETVILSLGQEDLLEKG